MHAMGSSVSSASHGSNTSGDDRGSGSKSFRKQVLHGESGLLGSFRHFPSCSLCPSFTHRRWVCFVAFPMLDPEPPTAILAALGSFRGFST